MSATQPSPTSAPQAETAAASPAAEPPRLGDGIELIGQFQDSGFKEPPFIARRADGQVVQLPEMLYRLAEQVDGQRDEAEIAQRFSERVQRQVQPEDVHLLIDERLRPLGVVAPAEGAPVELNKVDPLLALKFRAAVIPDRYVRSLTTLFKPLFLPPVVLAVVAGMLGLDAWLFFVHGISQSLRHTLYQPLLMLMLIGGVVLATAFHEVGHATACRYGGAKPGVMGVGIYIVWPAFYTDITDAYRLSKWGRLRTDLGGVYFNSIFALATVGVYALTSFEPLLLLIVIQNFAILQQSLPFLRLDGYYVLSDLTGVPDIFLRIKPVLASFIPGRPADERVTELKNWVRVVVSAYVVLVVTFLGFTTLMLVINLPRMAATGYDSVALHYNQAGPAFSHGKTTAGIVDIIQMVFLALPALGLAYTAARVGKRTTTGAISWSAGHPSRQLLIGTAGAAAIAIAAFSWLPNGEYRPIQPGERGTLVGAISQIAALPSGRPSLTAQRQAQLHGAPTLSGRSTASAGAAGKSQGGRSITKHNATPSATTPTTTSPPTPAGSGSSSSTPTTPAPPPSPGSATTPTTTDQSTTPAPQTPTTPSSGSSAGGATTPAAPPTSTTP